MTFPPDEPISRVPLLESVAALVLVIVPFDALVLPIVPVPATAGAAFDSVNVLSYTSNVPFTVKDAELMVGLVVCSLTMPALIVQLPAPANVTAPPVIPTKSVLLLLILTAAPVVIVPLAALLLPMVPSPVR